MLQIRLKLCLVYLAAFLIWFLGREYNNSRTNALYGFAFYTLGIFAYLNARKIASFLEKRGIFLDKRGIADFRLRILLPCFTFGAVFMIYKMTQRILPPLPCDDVNIETCKMLVIEGKYEWQTLAGCAWIFAFLSFAILRGYFEPKDFWKRKSQIVESGQ